MCFLFSVDICVGSYTLCSVAFEFRHSSNWQRRLTGLKCLGTTQTYAVIWIIRQYLDFIKSPPILYLWCTLMSLSSIILFADMLIRAIGSDRAINTIWHRQLRIKSVQLYIATIVITFGGFSKIVQQYRSRQGMSRCRRLCVSRNLFRRTVPC